MQKGWWRYFHQLEHLRRQQQAYCRQFNLPKVIERLFQTPLPQYDDDAKQLNYLALDFETTGLNVEQDHVISMGYIPLEGGQLDLSQAVETLVQSHQGVRPETAVINHIVPEMLAQGEPLALAMEQLFNIMAGKVLIAHGANIEKQFIDLYIRQRYQLPPLPLLWIDTLVLEKSLTIHKGNDKKADFRLAKVRERYQLPEYAAHGALIDALAAGELYLALLNRLYPLQCAPIGKLKLA